MFSELHHRIILFGISCVPELIKELETSSNTGLVWIRSSRYIIIHMNYVIWHDFCFKIITFNLWDKFQGLREDVELLKLLDFLDLDRRKL